MGICISLEDYKRRKTEKAAGVNVTYEDMDDLDPDFTETRARLAQAMESQERKAKVFKARKLKDIRANNTKVLEKIKFSKDRGGYQ